VMRGFKRLTDASEPDRRTAGVQQALPAPVVPLSDALWLMHCELSGETSKNEGF
jgi:hypothetical protein